MYIKVIKKGVNRKPQSMVFRKQKFKKSCRVVWLVGSNLTLSRERINGNTILSFVRAIGKAARLKQSNGILQRLVTGI